MQYIDHIIRILLSYKGHYPRENQTDIRELPEDSMCLAPPFVYDVVLWVLKLVQGGSH